MEIKIETNVPMPTIRNSTNSITGLLRKMNVGDSIVVPNAGTANRLANQILGKGNYACRKDKDGHRIWRIA